MSQAGPLDAESSNPQIPTSFITDDGTAIPINNQLELLAQVVPNAGIPFESTGAGNVVTYKIQYADDTPVSDATKVGLASFDSSSFSVDANGFVTLSGGGLAVESIGVQTGTNPIVPTAGGLITINGAVVAAGTNPVRSDGTGPNTMALEVQTSQALAASDATKIGLCNFDSARFSVDSNGFVTINGSGVAETITGDSGPALNPLVGNWNILGQQASTIAVMDTIGTAPNTLRIEDRTWQTQYVVDASSTVGLRGTFTTIQSAINQASSDGATPLISKTVFIRPGTYTENITLKSGVSLKALVPMELNFTTINPNTVIIDGQIIDNGVSASNVLLYGIQFLNSAATDVFVFTSNAFVGFHCCLIQPSNANAVTNVTTASQLSFLNCNILGPLNFGNGTLGIEIFTNNCRINGRNIIGQNCTWKDYGSFDLQSIALSSNACLQFVGTSFKSNTGTHAANITGSSSNVGTYFVNCNFNNRTSDSPAITATGQFIISGLANFNTLGSGFYSSAPTIVIGTSQQGDIIPSTVQTGATYSATTNDYYIGINRAGAVAVTLPTSNTPIDKSFIIKDQSGTAAANNITITPASGLIDGIANYVINNNYGSITAKFDGTNYFIL